MMSIFERSAKNERWIVLAGLALVVIAGLLTTLLVGDRLMVAAMAGGSGTLTYLVLLFIMWWTMMMAMMLPSAAPAILTFAAINRKLEDSTGAAARLTAFVSGYLLIWTGFALAIVMLQFLLEPKIELSMMMAVVSAAIGGGLLVAAGVYQMSPLKSTCLRKCQTPLLYFTHHWKKGSVGAFNMGLSHGLYCVGCCWVLMGLLFYGGVMELRWIVGLALYVALEKLSPAGSQISRFTGMVLIGWGIWILIQALA